MTIEKRFTQDARADWLYAEVPHMRGLFEVVVEAGTPFKVLTGFVYVPEETEAVLYIRTKYEETEKAGKYFTNQLKGIKSVSIRILTNTDERRFSGVRISLNYEVDKPLTGIKHFTSEYLAFRYANYFETLFDGLKLTPLPFM